MRFVTVMAGAASASPHGWGHGSGQRSPPMPALKCPTPRSVVSISTTRLDATQKTNSGKPLRKRPRVHVRHPSQLGPKGTHCSTGFAIRAFSFVPSVVIYDGAVGLGFCSGIWHGTLSSIVRFHIILFVYSINLFR